MITSYSFKEWAVRRDLHEQGQPLGQGVGPGLGHLNGMPEGDDEQKGAGATEARQAFRDLSQVIDRALTGPSGAALLGEIVNAIMNNDQVPDAVKQELKARVGQRWSNVIDLNQPGNPGKGNGLANQSPANKLGPGGFGMDTTMPGAVTPALPGGTF